MGQEIFPKHYELGNLVVDNVYTVDATKVQSGAVFTDTSVGASCEVVLPTLGSPGFDGYSLDFIQTHASHTITLAADGVIDWYSGNGASSDTNQSTVATTGLGMKFRATSFGGRWLVEVLTGSIGG